MSRNVIELALTRYYRQETNPNSSALRTLAQYDADRRAEALAEGADAINALPQDWECDPGRGDAAELLRRMAGEKSSRKADATPAAPEARTERYIAALRSADKYALVERRDDLARFAEAVIAVANDETDPVYRDGYAAGRMHAGGGGRLRDFTPVFTTSDGSDVPATELRCVLCGGLVQGVGPHTLLDLLALAAQHDCQTTRKDAD